uniref:Spi protease inhibitor domain-containing protein n=1 Tax=Flavobacterium pectinovorum TaxID=29533 RepID=A0A502EPD7_9FLAO
MKKNKIKPQCRKDSFFSVNLKKVLFLILGIFSLIGCSNEKEDSKDLNSSYNAENKVPTETINLIAQNFFKVGSPTSKGLKQSKTVKNTKEYKTSKKASTFYVVNYNEGGFLIVAADNRISPILAYSDTGNFETNDNAVIPPVASWMENQKNQIQATINTVKVQNEDIKQEWRTVSSLGYVQSKNSSTAKPIEPDPKTCPESTTVIVGPFIRSTWGQGDGYNNLLALNCSYSYYLGYKGATGCVATAMAQVMRYRQIPASYNWANMPDNGQYSAGTYDTQLLMKNIGAAVSMTYGCSASSAPTANIAPALKNTFGYSSADLGNFNVNTVISNLSTNQPVLIYGADPSNTSAHLWVCDGYRSDTIYWKDDNGNCSGATLVPMLHMNWGWDGSYDGYFTAGSFNPGTSSFNNGNKMVYNIH